MTFKNELNTLHKEAVDKKVEQRRKEEEEQEKERERARKKEQAEVPALLADLKEQLRKAAGSGEKKLSYVVDQYNDRRHGPKYKAVENFCKENGLGYMDNSNPWSMRYSDDTAEVDYWDTRIDIRW